MKTASLLTLTLTLALPCMANVVSTTTQDGTPGLTLKKEAVDALTAQPLNLLNSDMNPMLPPTAEDIKNAFTPANDKIPMAADADHAAVKENAEQRNKRMEWWRDAKFGMFIHYGLYSGLAGEWKGKPGGSEWIQKNVEIDTDTYAAETIPLFKPRAGATDEWAQLAREAGCRYAVLTSKHHDGFALFDSALTDYDSMDKVKRDIVKEYLTSFRKMGMRVGLYHSVIAWHPPSYDNNICRGLCYPAGQEKMLKDKGIPRNHAEYQKYLHGQVNEILTKYGTIDVLWWDYSQGDLSGQKGWKAPELLEKVRAINPAIITNNRIYAYTGLDESQPGTLDYRCGDYITPEKFVPKDGYAVDWESCIPVGDKWGFNRYDIRIKSSAEIIGKLVECVTKGGNMLLNINPMVDGTVPPKVAESFRGVGQWLRLHAEGVYGTRSWTKMIVPASINRQGDIFIFLPHPKMKDQVNMLKETAKNFSAAEALYDGYQQNKPLNLPLPDGYTKAALLGVNAVLPITDGNFEFAPELFPAMPWYVIKLSK